MAKEKQSKKQPEHLPLESYPVDRRSMESILNQAIQEQFGVQPTDAKLAEAQELMYQAFEEPSLEKRTRLARRALAVSPNCADAYVVLAECAASARESLELYERGVAAGEGALGREFFEENEGHFWGMHETRPYMRAREGLANCLWILGQREAAVEHAIALLRLNPNDNQGIRYSLLLYLLDLGRNEEAAALLAEYNEDSATWLYSRALLEFRKTGEGPRANKALEQASRQNPHVSDYILGLAVMPAEPPRTIQRGSESEAIDYAGNQIGCWKGTPGALAWMRKVLSAPLPELPKRSAPTWPQLFKKLMLLPLTEQVWQIDIRPLSFVVSGAAQAASPWVLLITCPEEDEILVVEVEPSRPDARQAWDYLIEAMLRPKEREAARPARVEVRLKSFWSRWRKKLGEAGIECDLQPELEHVERVLVETIAPLSPEEHLLPSGSPADGELPLAELAQAPEQVWQADVRRLPVWVSDAGEPRRPWSVMVADQHSMMILRHDLRAEPPDGNWLAESVLRAMREPGAGEPHRPGVVQVASAEAARALAAQLAESGVTVEVQEDLTTLNELFSDLAAHLSGPDKVAPLLEVPGIGRKEAGEFFAAAAEFYEQAPWRLIPGDEVIKVECPKYQSGPWYGVVMGQSGLTYGLALYEGLEVLKAIMSEGHTQQGAARNTSALSITYGEEFEMPIRDLEALEKNGWRVAAPEAYPSVMRVNPGFVVRPPLAWELELVEGCLRAMPEFLRMAGRKSAKFTVGVASGDIVLTLTRHE